MHHDPAALPWRALGAIALALAVAIALTWSNGLRGEPVFDDHALVASAQCFDSWQALRNTLRFVENHHCAYRPVRYWLFGIEYHLSGGAFAAHKLGNVLWHAAAAAAALLLAFLALVRSGVAQRRALALATIAALWWALHPLQTDSVTYVSGRRDILVGLFSLLTLALALLAETAKPRARTGLWAAAGVAFVLAALSKEVAAAIPALWIAWRLRDTSPMDFIRNHPRAARIAAVGLAAAAALALWRGVLRTYSDADGFWGGGPVLHYATALILQGRAVALAFLQAPLISDYHPYTIAVATGVTDPRTLAGLAVVLGGLAAALLLRRRFPIAFWGILFWFLAFAPSAQVFPHHELFAEHYLYLPLFGLVLAVVVLADAALSRLPVPPRVAAVAGMGVALVVAGGLAAATHVRNPVWENEFTLNRAVLAVAPENVRARYNLGNYLSLEGEDEEAVALLLPMVDTWAAVRVRDWHTLNGLARSGRRMGHTEAVTAAAEGLVERFSDFPLGHQLKAELALAAGDRESALAHAERWKQRSRQSEGPVRMRAAALAELGRLEEAHRLLAQLPEREPRTDALRCAVAGALGKAAEGCGQGE